MIPVTFTAETINHTTAAAAKPGDRPQGGACLVGPAGEQSYLLVMASGQDAIRTYAKSGSGSFTLVPSAQTGLAASGTGVVNLHCRRLRTTTACRMSLAVAMVDRAAALQKPWRWQIHLMWTAATGGATCQAACCRRHHLR